MDVMNTVALIFAVLAFAVAAWSLIQVEAFKRSTHQVTFLDPTKQQFEALGEETKKKLQAVPETFDNIM